jgi:hypothetical protein
MPWDVKASTPVRDWMLGTDDRTYAQIMERIKVLRQVGPGLGRPLVDSVKGSRHANMKELISGSSGRQKVRILFAFDPDRKAVLLIAGDKADNWTAWYKINIPLADDLLDRYLAGEEI